MSGIKPQALTDFYSSLRNRGLTTDLLALQLDVSGGTVRKLIGGLSGRRGPTWRNLCALLSRREIQLLNSVEQCSAWNIRQAQKRPVWTSEKEAAVKRPVLETAEVASG